MILLVEISGVILALTGSAILSTKPDKKLGSIAWFLFILADIFHSVVYFNNQQFAMVFNQTIGMILCIIGLTQSLLNNNNNIEKITRLMFLLFLTFITFAALMLSFTIFHYSLNKFEWMIALFALSGTTLMASKHKNAKYVYVIWLICDSVFLFLCILNQQFAIAVLRLTFISINLNGLKNWFMPNGISIKNFVYTIKSDIFVKQY